MVPEKEILALPISSIEDGWDVRGGKLYLFVKTGKGTIQTIMIDRPPYALEAEKKRKNR